MTLKERIEKRFRGNELSGFATIVYNGHPEQSARRFRAGVPLNQSMLAVALSSLVVSQQLRK